MSRSGCTTCTTCTAWCDSYRHQSANIALQHGRPPTPPFGVRLFAVQENTRCKGGSTSPHYSLMWRDYCTHASSSGQRCSCCCRELPALHRLLSHNSGSETDLPQQLTCTIGSGMRHLQEPKSKKTSAPQIGLQPCVSRPQRQPMFIQHYSVRFRVSDFNDPLRGR